VNVVVTRVVDELEAEVDEMAPGFQGGRGGRRTKQSACGGGGFIRQSSFPCQRIPTRLTLPGRAHTCFGGGDAPNPP